MAGKILFIIVYFSLLAFAFNIWLALNYLTVARIIWQSVEKIEPPKIEVEEEEKNYTDGILRRMQNLKQFNNL